MYPEFIAIYVGLAILLVLTIVNMVLLVKVLKSSNSTNTASANQMHYAGAHHQAGGVVFCKNCATEYDTSQRACPNCGTPR